MSEIPFLGPTDDLASEHAQQSKDYFDNMVRKCPQGKCSLLEDYWKHTGEELGLNNSGNVFRAKHGKTGQEVVLKKVPYDQTYKNGLPLSFVREIAAARMLKHENVIRCLDIAVAKDMRVAYLVLEYCEEELGKVLEQIKLPLAQDEIKNIMWQLMNGLSYIHEMNFVHQDINPSNLLLASSGVLKICDFGDSRMIPPSGDMIPGCGANGYQAPEIIFRFKNFTTAVDLWSAGCVFGEMVKNAPLFKPDNELSVISKIIELLGTPNNTVMPGFSETYLAKHSNLREQPYNMIGAEFKELPNGAKMMLKQLLAYSPDNRPTAKQTLASMYFREQPTALDTPHLIIGIMAKKQLYECV